MKLKPDAKKVSFRAYFLFISAGLAIYRGNREAESEESNQRETCGRSEHTFMHSNPDFFKY
ncbi:hypothetical protein BCR33DRAFT_718768 [Rhizoclosmatium globosum]|uniref:Uncharacterized protein n=1 Tax=Rhizoclosmatium globosum TaxID=329046 RepID=A0A1Y2C3N3_9FUNG|nr:hypothetical protein BCR33DRAFT_718768 [Rhizoclosmatium globosum]|eukprot:ORY41611.1 hypothetical protein BCR33DRAFT_718768 [Rhizoclosmatium globosum]